MAKPTKAQLENMKKKLGLTDEEIAELVQADYDIDHNKKMDFDLTPEQQKIARSFAKFDTKNKPAENAPTIYKLDNTSGKRSRKENPTKANIIAEFVNLLENSENIAYSNVNVLNKERLIAFSVGNTNFELTLTQKRAPKS